MYQTSSDPNLDGPSWLKKYISKRNVSCEAFFQYPKRKGAEHSDVVWYENRPLGVNKLQSMMRDISIIADLYQSFCKSHGHHFTVRCPDILPSHNEYLRSPQRREHQALQHEAFVKSTSPVFGCLVRGAFLAKHFKPFDTAWIACQSSRTTPVVGCSCSKYANHRAVPAAAVTAKFTISNSWKRRHVQLLPNSKH